MKYLFHNKFRIIIFHDQKTLSLTFKSNRLQMFLNIYKKHPCWSFFYYSVKKRLQHRRFPVNIAKFFRTTSFQEHLRTAASVLLINYWASANLFLFKNNMEWFLLRRFVDLVRIYFILIISRNHSNTVKHYIKGYLF